jgi:hypothetical protein
MPSTKVIKPTTYEAYECDGPTCREVCESYNARQCNWINLPMPDPHHDEHRHFHSWACLAEYACWRQERLPLKTRQASASPGLPF